ncbi:MAG: TetR/AcrR family transcriptional regulator [Thermoleophilia bacterium]|nr:TetR/AcrR family transcriptional regulator [Thermoleophilia bacterium]
MANSTAVKPAGKRERLVAGARSLIHEQGVQRTTIAEVAERADVPVGNVYYYFKTKDELVGAVVDGYIADIQAALVRLDRHRTPQARLKALVQMWVDQREDVAQHGCPLGSLCSELGKNDGSGLDVDGAEMLRIEVDWAEGQFRSLGRRDARDLAISLLSGIQGAALLANTFREPEILSRQARRLDRWIDSLA